MPAALNICLISREFPPDTAFGGMATFSCETALMLKARGHRVTVFSQSLGASHVADYHGVPVVKLKVPPPFGSYRLLPLFILAFNTVIMREVMRHHRRRPFDLIDVPDHLAEGLFATFTGIPVVTRLHTPFALLVSMGLNNYRKNLSYRLIKTMEKTALRRSRVFYAPCMDLVHRCRELLGADSVPEMIFGYPVDLDLFSPAAAAAEVDTPLRILFLGRLEQRKGIETIVEAFPKVVARHPGCTLTLVGSDTPNIRGFSSARQFMEIEFRRAGCLDRVRFENYVPLAKLPAFFREHDIVWVPSLYDNFPLICLEAMACGKAVVVSDAGGLPEMVQAGETGMIFPVGDAEALAENTGRLCDNPELRGRLGRNARRYAERNCSPDIIYDKTMELYQLALRAPAEGEVKH
jgi:glycosyltransferase involved in cell wall biosynthesis